MISPMVATAEHPDTDDFMSGDRPGPGVASSPVLSVARVPEGQGGPASSVPTGEGQVLAAVPADVPVAVRAADPTRPTSDSKPARRSRPGRRRVRDAAVSARRPEEWVLDPGEFSALPDRDYQELWFELRTWTWKSLAVVPTVSGVSELDVAEKLVVVGVSNTNRRMSLISAEGATVADTDRVIAMIRAAEARGDRVIVCTDSVYDNPSAAPIIRAVNGAVLSVRLGRSEKAVIERTVATIHRNRIIGVITRRP